MRGGLSWRGAQLYDSLAPTDCEREYSCTIRDGVATLVLHDCIGEAFDGAPADRILADIERVAKSGVERLDIYVNSVGGDARSALAIHDALRSLDVRIVARVNGIAASAATIVALAGDEILMDSSAFL